MNLEQESLGLRNNNPGNIRKGSDWKGLSLIQPEINFCGFESVEWGIRAIYRTLLTYCNKYEIVSVHSIINRWAPSNENNTPAYINSVVNYIRDKSGKDHYILDNIWSEDVVIECIAGIIYHENGVQPFSLKFIESCALRD